MRWFYFYLWLLIRTVRGQKITNEQIETSVYRMISSHLLSIANFLCIFICTRSFLQFRRLVPCAKKLTVTAHSFRYSVCYTHLVMCPRYMYMVSCDSTNERCSSILWMSIVWLYAKPHTLQMKIIPQHRFYIYFSSVDMVWNERVCRFPMRLANDVFVMLVMSVCLYF